MKTTMTFLLTAVWWSGRQHRAVETSEESKSAASVTGHEEHSSALWWTRSESASDPPAGPRELPSHTRVHLRPQVCPSHLVQMWKMKMFSFYNVSQIEHFISCVAWQLIVTCSEHWLKQGVERMNFLTQRWNTLGQRRWITLSLFIV